MVENPEDKISCDAAKQAVMQENWFSGFLTKSKTNLSVQSQKQSRSLKFWI